MDCEYAFSDSDVNLLKTIAHSMSAAIENARLFDETQRLLKETEERAQELAIINSVQAGLAQQLDVQAVFDLVGDMIRDTFDAQKVIISTHDPQTNLRQFPYVIDGGQRKIVLELTGVEFMSSAGLRGMVSTLKACRGGGGDLVVAAPSNRVVEVMQLAGLTSLFTVFDDVTAAVASF